MRVVRQALLIAMAGLLLSLSGCVFKKKQPPVPQQGHAPTVTAPEPTPPPAEQPAPPEPQPSPAPEPQPAEKTEAVEKPKPKPKKKPVEAKKPAATQQQTQASAATAAPQKTSKLIIQEGSAPNSQGQLAAGVSLEDPSSRKQTTEQLLQSAQTNLNSINRPLSPEEQAMVSQIKDYIAQSRKATADSDTVRAHNLAVKARLLSDELVKR